jgi:hypothetical protein
MADDGLKLILSNNNTNTVQNKAKIPAEAKEPNLAITDKTNRTKTWPEYNKAGKGKVEIVPADKHRTSVKTCEGNGGKAPCPHCVKVIGTFRIIL